ncbi:MAG: hypothetical protein IJ691_09500 [Lachnospiraceae bacterium]|nr:hypothetical protein [Lachnospiraceae bacterium]
MNVYLKAGAMLYLNPNAGIGGANTAGTPGAAGGNAAAVSAYVSGAG